MGAAFTDIIQSYGTKIVHLDLPFTTPGYPTTPDITQPVYLSVQFILHVNIQASVNGLFRCRQIIRAFPDFHVYSF